LTIPALQIEGLCWAKPASEIASEDQKQSWLSKEDHFVIVESYEETTVVGQVGLHLHERQLDEQEVLYRSYEPLKGMELFAGL